MIFVLHVLTLILSSYSISTATECRAVVSQSQKSHFDLSDFHLPSLKVPTATISRTVVKDGRSYHIIQRTAARWASKYSPDNENYQGDPRNFITIFGEKISSKFGFQMLSNLEMQTATTETFNQLILENNKKLSKPIKLKFYQASADPVGDLEYVKLVEKNLWPEAINGHYFLHDIAYHRNFIIPQIVTDFMNQRSQYTRNFLTLVRLQTESFPPALKQKLAQIENTLIQFLAGNFDVMSGNMMIVTAERYGDPSQFEKTEHYEKDVLHRIHFGLNDLVQDIWLQKAMSAVSDYALDSHALTSSYSEWTQTLYTVQESYLKNIPQRYLEKLNLNHQQLALLIDRRIQKIKSELEN